MKESPTVLVIDDNPVNSTLVQAVLEKDGIQTLHAESGPDGRLLAQIHSPDLILLDIIMPGECGFETCDALKLDPRTAEIPIIFLSSMQEAEKKVKGLTLGAVDYVTKPFNREELLARTRLHIRLRQGYALPIKDRGATMRQRAGQSSARIQPFGPSERLLNPGAPKRGLTSETMSVRKSANKRSFLSSIRNQVSVGPGEQYVSKEKVIIRTILGSCVAACLWDQPNGIVGMNHFLLTGKRNASNLPFSLTEAGRYGMYAMEMLINAMIKLGARRENLRAKVFGGSSVLINGRADNFFAIGEENSHFIVEFLRTDGIPLVRSDLGGNVGRVIYFSSEDFSVYVRKLGEGRQNRVAQEEQAFWRASTEREEKASNEPEIWL